MLLNKKITPHYMKKRWQCIFEIKLLDEDWSNIYRRKIKNQLCTKCSEFNYKLIHNLIYSGYIINKWNKSIPNTCRLCKNSDTAKHM